jgi:hypothetical protein
MGGLGNQIFQIFTTISYAIKTRQQFKFYNTKVLGSCSTILRYTFWDTFFSRLKIFTTSDFPLLKVIKEKDFTYNELPINEITNNNILINGYFQSYKYFAENYEIICRIIGLEQMKDALLKKMNYEFYTLDNSISMHFRLGDYKKIPEKYNILKREYYENSINYIKNRNLSTNFTIFYFCEDEDISEVETTINYLKDNFSEYRFIRGEKSLSDWEQLLLMSCCNHNIIANSTFSWWGAYFNSFKNKIVCYPSEWFGPEMPLNTKDLFPIDWIKINC